MGAALAAAVALAIYDPRRVRVPQNSPVIVNLARFPTRPIIPDLSAAGVSLTGLAFDADGEIPLVSATYRGPGGCQLRLFATPMTAAPRLTQGSDRKHWQVADIRYTFAGFGMAHARFEVIAVAAEQATRNHKLAGPLERHLRDVRTALPDCNR